MIKAANYKYLKLPCMIVCILCLSVIFNAVCLNNLSLAQNVITNGLTLSPIRSELGIAPGTSIGGVLTVANSTDKTMEVNFSAEEFSVINQQYDYTFKTDSDLTKWVTFTPAKVSLAAGESKKVSFLVGVPVSAEPGGRYISLFAGNNSASSDYGMNFSQRVASLLYITVAGNVSKTGRLLSLSSPWVVNDNGKWDMTLQNTGSTHFTGWYNIKSENIINHSISSSISGEALILPGTIREVTGILPLPKIPGVYKITYVVTLGDTPAITNTRYVLYIPVLLLVIIVFVIVVLFLSVGRIRLLFKKHC